MTKVKEKKFTGYQVFIIAILAFIQFTVVLDFMVMSPLGPMLRPMLKVSPFEFAMVVSAYAFSAGGAGFLAAGFADKFDRKKMLLFFYSGFVIGTLLCGIANDYYFLLGARIITGIFGGVIGSIGFAIITDLFKMEVRGTVMGFVMTSFSAAQVFGLPIGLYLANKFGWHSPFLMIVGLCVIVGIIIMIKMKPINAHLNTKLEHNPFLHLVRTVFNDTYARAFAATMLLATGGFMLMPFGADFSVHNLGLSIDQLPILYGVTGLFSMITGPLVGKFSDRIGKYKLFVMGSVLSMVLVAVYCNLGITPFYAVILLNVILFVGISARMISSSALVTGVPELKDRGAFMSVNSSVQQIAGAIATTCAGLIVYQRPDGVFEHYDTLGYIVVGTTLITIALMYPLNQYVMKKLANAKNPTAEGKPEISIAEV